MSFSAARPLNPALWLGLPAAACIGATVVFAAPINLLGFRLPEPVFPLVPAFAWAVIRPSVLAPFVLILLGLFLDYFWGGMIGMWAVCLLLAYGVALFGRGVISGQGAGILWVWYGCACVIAIAGAAALVLLVHRGLPGIAGLFWQFLVTLVLYPFAHKLIERFEDADVRFR